MKISFKNAILTYTNSIWIQFYIPSPTHTQLCNFHSEVKYNFSERNVGVQRFKNDNQHLFYTLVDIVRLPTKAEIYTFFFPRSAIALSAALLFGASVYENVNVCMTKCYRDGIATHSISYVNAAKRCTYL